MVHYNGTEFIGWEFQIILETYGIKSKPTIVKKPVYNAIVERIHLTMGDILRTYNFTGLNCQDETNTILFTLSWVLRSTVHTTDGYSHRKKVFNGCITLHINVVANW